MNIRQMTIPDLKVLDELHDKYFPEFSKTDFLSGFLGAFIIEDEGKIIMGGGVRPLAETVLVTDKSINPHVIGKALLEALEFSKFACKRNKIELLHAFIKDESYMKHLIQHGFQKRAQALYLEV